MTKCELDSSGSCAGFLGPTIGDACGASGYFLFLSLLNAFVRKNEKISGLCERVESVERPNYRYDFVVIGGGGGGAAVAGRLSEIPNWNVLLLEAGDDEPVGTAIPGFATRFLETNAIWDFATTNESHACLSTNGSCTWTSGKNLGGNTAHNGMIYLRGKAEDYDNWAELGNEGWSWKEVEEFFKKGEDNGEIERVGRKYHGTGGPLSVERLPYVPSIADSILAASIEAGFGVSEDLNGDVKYGFSIVQSTNKKGIRSSSSRAYIRPVMKRKNLHVSLNSTVTRVIIKNDRAVGVEYFKDGELRSVYVTKEVVLSAGVVNSPKILLLSGIGPKKHLESMGIKVVKDLSGVGENLHDHPCATITFTINEPDVYDNDWAAAADYLANQRGPLSGTGMIQVVGMVSSDTTTPELPDIEIYIISYLSNCASGNVGALQSTGKRQIAFLPSYLYPKSRGRITLASKDPLEYPVIWANYLGEPEDLEHMVQGIKKVLTLLDTEELRGYNFTLSDPLLGVCSDQIFLSDEYWACFARQTNYPVYHQGGTCKMGPSSDPMAVVDPQLRVYGIRGLRVADNSIMPQIPGSNTQAPAMMIGERAADFIKKYWTRS